MSHSSGILDFIESTGNRLPHPAMLFVYLCAVVLAASFLGGVFHWQAEHPLTGETILAVNLLSVNGLHRILQQTVSNFVNFAPVGSVLVAVMGIGIAEHSGLLAVALRALVLRVPSRLLSFSIVLAGVLSSIAMDVGYVVLIPLAALIYKSAGRNPLLGIAAAFAGVSGGFSANLLIGPVDAVLAGISTEAAKLMDADYVVGIAANYYFMLVSTLLISVVGAWVTDFIVARRLDNNLDKQADIEALSAKQVKALKVVGLFTLVFIGMLLIGLLPEQGILRDPVSHSIVQSPFIHGIVVVVAVYAGLAGIIFGRVSSVYQKNSDFIAGMESTMSTMAGYLVLFFFAAQFVNYFAWSNLGTIISVQGAAMLTALQLPPVLLIVLLVFVTAIINLFIGSSSAKWALLAPVLVPMLMLVNIPPEATQLAYRVGDSCTNIITPLMPYFGVVLVFAQKHDARTGIGTIAALMLPYSIAFLAAWTLLLLIWIGLGIPLGPGV